MQTDVGLQTLGESLEHGVHVDAVRVGPRMLEILLQSLPQRVRYLVEPDELSDPQHLRVVPCGPRVQPLYDGGNVAEDAGVHERCGGGKSLN